MIMKAMRLGRVAPGVRDILPVEALCKRNIEDKFAALVRAWGYREVVTPSFEYHDNLVVNRQESDRLFKFLDRQGQLMALRPDMTRPIARMVATQLQTMPVPLRLYYLANAFSYEEAQAGKQREFFQAGLELLGAATPEADAEVLALATGALKQTGLQDFQISVGHVGIFYGLMAELGLSEAAVQQVKEALSNKDFVQMADLLSTAAASPAEARRVLDLLELRGGPEVFVRAAQLCGDRSTKLALENLSRVYEILTNYGLHRHINIDLGLLRGLDYYTGLVFEGYTVGVGFPICGGGRYDRLLRQYGHDLPATGFAVTLDRVLAALEKQEGIPAYQGPDVFLAWAPGVMAAAIDYSSRLRQAGKTVAAALAPGTPEQAVKWGQEAKAGKIIYIGSDGESTVL